MTLDVLPPRLDGAAGNMATDFLLLHRYPTPEHVRFRHYGWHRPAVTFGFSQKIGWVRDHLGQLQPSAAPDDGAAVELCRRPTGGGIVDHRDDWTYALVLPRTHPLAEGRVIEAYRVIHAALVEALRKHGCLAELKRVATDDAADPGTEGVCFQRPELYDVVGAGGSTKLAGAAIKRSKRGLLLQGSIWRPAARSIDDWEELETSFSTALAGALGADPVQGGWPEWDDDEAAALTEQYASAEWLEQR